MYKTWHDFRYSHHIHVVAAIITLLAVIITNLLPINPQNQLFAASGSWTQTTFTGSGDGTYTSTQPYNSNNDVGLDYKNDLSNAGGGKWQYKRPITVTNSSGGTLTDYQVQVQPFNDAANGNQAGYRYESGLQGSWHLSEGGSAATTADLSGNSNTGTLSIGAGGTQTTNTQAWTNGASGRFGSSLNFDGTDDFVNCGNGSSLNITGTISIEAWIKTTSTSGQYIVAKQNLDGTAGYSLILNVVAGKLGFRDTVGNHWENSNSTGYNDGNWHHVAVVLSSGTVTFYKDGASDGSASAGINTTSENLMIGRASVAGGGGPFSGQIDETKIYNRALSATEITNRYNSNAPKIRHDYQDLRFTNSAGTTEYAFWQETDGRYWVKVPSLATGDNTVNMYYGNASATFGGSYANSGTNTFVDFSDFTDLTGWTQQAGSWTTSGGELVFPGNAGAPTSYLRRTSQSSLSTDYIVRSKFKLVTNAQDERIWLILNSPSPLGTTNGSNSLAYSQAGGDGNRLTHNYYSQGGFGQTTAVATMSADTWYLSESRINDAQDRMDVWTIDSTSRGSLTTSNTINGGDYWGFMNYYDGPNRMDWVFIRKYTATEPTHTAPGAETTPYMTSGNFVSLAVPTTGAHQGKVYAWGDLTFTRVLNGQTLTFDVLDGATSTPIGGYTGINVSPTSLAGISAYTYPSLKIRANFSGDSTTTALLNDVSVAYSYDITGPTVPTTLTVGTVTSTSVPLSWTASTDSESGVAGYEVQRAPDSSGVPGTWATAGGTCAGTVVGTSCTDSGLSSNTKYWFRVRAKDNVSNYSGWTGEMNVDSNVVGLWHLNEGGSSATTADSSGNNNTGTLSIGAGGTQTTNTQAWTNGANGRFDKSINFDGTDDKINVADSSSVDILGAETVELWMKPTALAARSIIAKDQNASNRSFAFEMAADGSINAIIISATSAYIYRATPASVITAGTWNHVVFTYDGGTSSNGIKIYVNGVQLDNTGGSGGSFTGRSDNEAPLTIGYRDYTPSAFSGQIDEVRISNTVRSGTDILAYYNEANPNPKSATTLPGVPTSPTATAASASSINPISWTAPAGGADHYHMRSSSDAYATLKYNGSGTSTSESGLSANTQYTYRIWAVNASDQESSSYASVSAYTWPNAPTGQSATAASTSQIDVSWSAGAGGANHYHVRSSSDSYATIKYDNSTPSWSETLLSPNTQYTYRIYAVNADNVENTSYVTTSRYTLANVPTSPSATAASTSQMNVSWTAPTGGANHYHMRSSSDGYATLKYDSTGTSTNETGLSANTQYTYRIWAVNADNVESATYATVSRYTWPNAPTGQSATAASNSQIDLTWSAGSGGANHYHVRSSSDSYATIKYDDVAAAWSETLLSPNTQYTYRIYAVNADNVENTGYVTVSRYTLTNTPALNPMPYANTQRPAFTNTGNGDANLASKTIRLYRGITLMATTTADGSGVYTFSSGDYGASTLDEGNNTVHVHALNDDNEESAPSPERTVLVDIQNPVNPSLTGAWTNSGKTSQITNNDWSGNNNVSSVYFEWNGAFDEPVLGTPSGIKRYHIYFGSNGSAVPKDDGTPTTGTEENATRALSSPTSGTDYYMRLQVEDNAENYSGAITLFTYKFDNTPPSGPTTITPDPAGWSTTNSFDFEWTNWTETHSGMDYYLYIRKETAGGDTYEAFDLVNRKVTDVVDPINLNNVTALYTGINWIRVYATDKAGNQSTVYGFAPYFYSGTVAGPTITSTPNFNTVNSFAFTLDKPVGITADGYYCGVETPVSPSNSTYIKLSELPKTVSINGHDTNATLAGDTVSLSAFAAAKQQGENYLYCATEDNLGNIGWSSATSDNFTVSTVAPDVPSGMKITDASDRSTSNWALTVGWTALTGQPPDFNGYKVYRCVDADCSNDANYSLRADVSSNIYSEASLDNTKDYYYKVKSKDNVGNTSAYSATVHRIPTGKYTTPPTYTSGPTANPKATSVTITWSTNRASNTIVQYGTTTSYGQEASKSTEAVTAHTIDILGLSPGTTYHFRVQSLDADRDYDPAIAYSGDFTFTTSQAPGISNVEISEIRLTSAIITWKTTSSATSKILYGTTTAYGKTYIDQSSSQTTTHTVKLTDLSDSTTYNFRIQGVDIEGNVLNSDNYVFTTLTFPKLSNLKVSQVPNTPTSTIEVTFDSNVPTTSLVTVTGNGGKDMAKYDLETSHKIKVTGLQDDTQYTITAKGRDQYGNEANPVSSAYKTEFDTRPPFITDITTETSIVGYGTDARGQIVISWNTDEPASSQIEYASGVAGSEYTSKTQEDTSLTENHVVIISDLKPSAPYHFSIVSRDKAGNTGRSADNSVLTQQASESILDLIIKSLQATIGWIFNVFSRG